MKFLHPVSHDTFLLPDRKTEDESKKFYTAKLII